MDATSLERFLNASRQDCNHAITVVITGANSGIGLSAAKMLSKLNPKNRIVLACRTLEKAEFARDQILESLPDKDRLLASLHLIPLVCDHCSLDSVKQFVVNLRRKLDEANEADRYPHTGIDALCLNAGVIFADGSSPTYTVDGFETTFQTNHLAPFVIAKLTSNFINPGGRVIFSTSGLHLRHRLDLKGIIDPVNKVVQKHFEMINGNAFHYKDSYSLSKLCNVATCAELHEYLQQQGHNALSLCFSPGLMLDSGLFRHQTSSIHPIPEAHREAVMLKAKTVAWGGGALAYMVWADEPAQKGAVYWRDESNQACKALYGNEFCPTPISEENVSVTGRKELWRVSCELARIVDDNNAGKFNSETYKCTVA
ncbi:hypothetical protein MPSEU_001073700 [Mayamaea pseudoterrestris]|nr:hypothetical protein MPSEU_001073700 [Mayamaea pseudoterrestris]